MLNNLDTKPFVFKLIDNFDNIVQESNENEITIYFPNTLNNNDVLKLKDIIIHIHSIANVIIAYSKFNNEIGYNNNIQALKTIDALLTYLKNILNHYTNSDKCYTHLYTSLFIPLLQQLY